MLDDAKITAFAKRKIGVKDTDLTALMSLYEENYLLIRRLCPALPSTDRRAFVSHVPGAMDLQLQILEATRYTSTLLLSYQRRLASEVDVAPDFRVRVYHDAQVAEACGGLLHGLRYEERKARSLQASWRLNRFLYKWLGFCLRQGHRFVDTPFGVDTYKATMKD